MDISVDDGVPSGLTVTKRSSILKQHTCHLDWQLVPVGTGLILEVDVDEGGAVDDEEVPDVGIGILEMGVVWLSMNC